MKFPFDFSRKSIHLDKTNNLQKEIEDLVNKIDELEVQNIEIEKTFLLLLNVSKGFERIKKRDNSKKLNLSRLVTSAGFKPATS